MEENEKCLEDLILQIVIDKLEKIEIKIAEKKDVNAIINLNKCLIDTLADIHRLTLERIDSVDNRRLQEDRINYEYFNERFEMIEKKYSGDFFIALKKTKIYILIAGLTACLLLSFFITIKSLKKYSKNELNALKYQVLHFSEEESMVRNAYIIDNLFLETPINQIKKDLTRLEQEEKQQFKNFQLAKKKEDEANRLKEEANKLKNQ